MNYKVKSIHEVKQLIYLYLLILYFKSSQNQSESEEISVKGAERPNQCYKELIEDRTQYWEYEWDAVGNLRKVTKSDGYVEEYIYDESGIKVKTITPNNTTISIYDGDNLIYEKDNDGEKEYIYAFSELLTVITNDEYTYYHSDILGSTRFVTDSSGEVLQESIFTPFGKELLNFYNTGGAHYVYKYAMHEGQNLKTGLTYMSARWMDNEAGRFISADPAMQGVNYYVYSGNNPTTNIDPSGLYYYDQSFSYNYSYSNYLMYSGNYGAYNSFWNSYETTYDFNPSGYLNSSYLAKDFSYGLTGYGNNFSYENNFNYVNKSSYSFDFSYANNFGAYEQAYTESVAKSNISINSNFNISREDLKNFFADDGTLVGTHGTMFVPDRLRDIMADQYYLTLEGEGKSNLFMKQMSEHFGFTHAPRYLPWSGKNNDDAREIAKNEFKKYIMDNFSPEDVIYFFGHSHGPNVFIPAANELYDAGFKNIRLISLETPSLEHLEPMYKLNENIPHLQVYSRKDKVLRLGSIDTDKDFLRDLFRPKGKSTFMNAYNLDITENRYFLNPEIRELWKQIKANSNNFAPSIPHQIVRSAKYLQERVFVW